MGAAALSIRLPLQVYLVRHGQTEWSLTQQHTGRTDIGLTDFGKREARGLTARLSGVAFAKVLTSPFRRARQTCELAGLDASAEIDGDFAEWDYGDYEGRRAIEIHQERAGWNVFRDGCPNGESVTQVSDRAHRVIRGLVGLTGNVAVFTHGHFARALATCWLGLPLVAAQHFSLDTASVSILGHDPGNSDVATMVRWNVTSTLVSGSMPVVGAPDGKALNPTAIERWENEGGETLHAGLFQGSVKGEKDANTN